MALDRMDPEEFLALTYAHARRHAPGRRQILGGFGALAGAAALSGLPFRAARAEGSGGTLRIGRDQEPDSLDPHKTSLAISEYTNLLIYEPLVRLDSEGKIVPGLAERWEFADGNKTLLFHLRDGVVFHDGSPADAETCAWTTRRMLDPATAAPSVFRMGPLDRAEAVDRLTVAYRYKEPFVPVWIGLAGAYAAIIPRQSVESLGDQFGRNPVGCGPFRFTGWAPDSGIRLVRFDGYKCGPLAAPDGLQLLYFPEDSTRLAALETGEIDALAAGQAVPADSIRRLRRGGDIQLLSRPAQSLRAISFNQGVTPFDDIRMRRAISHAIDPEKVLAFALDGNGVVARGPVASTIPGYSKAVETLGYSYDPAKARALMAEAGQGEGLRLRAIANDTAPVRRAAEIVQAQLLEIGVELEIQSMPIGEWQVLSRKGEHHLIFTGYTYNEADILYPEFHSQGSLNRSFRKQPELDRLIEAQRVEFDEARRQAILDEAQALIMREAYWVPLFEPLAFAALSPAVKGAVLRSDGNISLDRAWIES